MTKVYFHGDYRTFAGPSNANRYILESSDGKFVYQKAKNKYIKRLEYILKIIFSDVTIFAGGDVYASVGIKLAKKLGKKTAYLMHGCYFYECGINGVIPEERFLQSEKFILENVDLIICVSEIYAGWVKNYFPHLKCKITFANSGINVFEKKKLKPYEERTISVAAAGGDLPQKNNEKICKALFEENIVLNIYGKKKEESKSEFYKGELKQDLFFKELENTKLFVVNSSVESFSLAAADALERGCSILVSKNSGIRSVLKLEDTDIIFDIDNENEIAEKVKYLLSKPNNERIVSSIDFEESSWKKTAENIYNKVQNL